MPTYILYETKDNAEGQLNAGITGSSTSIVLKSGEGAEFPQPNTGTASSAGTSTTLNDTGDLGNVAVGDFIRNVTDGSWAFCTVAGTNSITTTRLRGGTDNSWDNTDEWQHKEFVVTLEVRDADGDVTAREKVLIKNRSTDTLTVRTRGYDSSTAQAFSANDYVNLHVVSNQIEHLFDMLYSLTNDVMIQLTTLPVANGGTNRTSAPTDTIVLSAAGMWASTTTGAAAPTKVETTTNKQNYYVIDFDQSIEEYAECTVFMPDRYDGGTITAAFVWTAASGSGNVIWALQARAYADDDAIDQVWGTAQTVTDALIATGDVHISAATSAITIAGSPAGGRLVQFRVYRDADAGGDTHSADARLIAVKIEYSSNAYSD